MQRVLVLFGRLVFAARTPACGEMSGVERNACGLMRVMYVN
jgi:hypothetical protein